MAAELPPIAVAILLGSGLLALALACGAASARRRPLRVASGVLAVAVLTPGAYLFLALRHPGVLDARFRAYHAFYHDLGAGMTRAEVSAAMARHYPEGGDRRAPIVFRDEPSRLGLHMHAEGRTGPNCEGILLEFRAGRVTHKHYSRD